MLRGVEVKLHWLYRLTARFEVLEDDEISSTTVIWSSPALARVKSPNTGAW